MNLLLAALVGLGAGVHTSTWGMYKDAPHEGFTWPKYIRSTIIGTVVALFLALVTDLHATTAAGAVVLFGVTYALERLVVEYWKTFIREEDQSKYFIPMRLAVFGKVVTSRPVRWTVGAVAAVLLTGLLWGASKVQAEGVVAGAPRWLVVLIVGSLGGWISAFGGAWKDAPIEGFETFKFFRSPSVSLLWSLALAQFTSNILWIGIGALGFTIATIETYKTFFFPSKPRGKFAGKPILFPEYLTRRYRFVPIYVSVWLSVLSLYGIAFTQPHQGLLHGAPAQAPTAAQTEQPAGSP